MGKNILLIQGHPDASQDHLCHMLADAYASSATDAGHTVRYSKVAELDFPLLRNQREWEAGEPPDSCATARMIFAGVAPGAAQFRLDADPKTPLAKRPLARFSARVIAVITAIIRPPQTSISCR